MKAFFLELKSICKNFRFLALIFLLLCLLVMIFAQFKIQQVNEYQLTLRSLNWEAKKAEEWVVYWGHHKQYYLEHGVPRTYYDIETVEEYLRSSIQVNEEAQALAQYYQDKDWSAYNLALSNQRGDSPYYSYLADKDLRPIGPWDTTPWGFLFNSLRKLVPKVLGFIVLIISVNRLHKDRKDGSIKTSLQKPKKRTHYLMRKTALGFVSSCLIILIPLLSMFTILGVKQGYTGANLPVLYAKDKLFQVSVSDEDIFELQDYPMTHHEGLSQLTTTWISGRVVEMEHLALWKFLLLVAVVLALFILFSTVLAMLISVVIKNEILAQIVAIVTFILGTLLSRIFPKLKTLPLDLFSKADGIAILEGSHCSTYLGSIIALVTATIILFALSAFIFRKQDIH